MRTYVLNGKPYQVPTQWADVRLRQLRQLMLLPAEHAALARLAVLTGVPEELLAAAPREMAATLAVDLAFTAQMPEQGPVPKTVTLAGKEYRPVLDLQTGVTLGQYIDQDEYMERAKAELGAGADPTRLVWAAMPGILSTLVLGGSGPYDAAEAYAARGAMEEMDAVTAWTLAGFFLRSASLPVAYFGAVEAYRAELRATLSTLAALPKRMGGRRRSTAWLMGTLLKLTALRFLTPSSSSTGSWSAPVLRRRRWRIAGLKSSG